MIATHETDELLGASDIFQGLDRRQLAWLLQVSQQHEIRRGEIVFGRGEILSRLFVLLSGHVQLTVSAAGEPEKVVEFLQPGDVFGESAFMPNVCTRTCAQALSAVRLLAIELEVFSQAVADMPSLSMCLLSKLSLRLEQQIQAQESAAFKTAAQRVAEYVLRQPRIGNQARLIYHKRLIASKLDLQPETFSRSLKQLVADGLINVQGANITIRDEQRLQALAA